MKKRTLFLAMMLLATSILPIACSSEGNTAQQEEKKEEKKEKKETQENQQGEDKEYAQILKELMTDENVAAAMNTSMKDAEDALVQMLTANGIERSEAEAKVDRLMNETIEDLNIKHFLPYCKKHLTIQELKEVKEIYNTKEYQKLNSMTAEAQMKHMRHLEATMSQAAISIMSGEEPEPVERNAGYSDRYMSLCKEFIEVTNFDTLMDNFMSQMSMAMGGNEESNKAIEALGKYFKENLATMYANMNYGIINEEDLEKLIGYTKKPAMQKFMQANLERSKNLEGYINDVNSKVNEFITENTK